MLGRGLDDISCTLHLRAATRTRTSSLDANKVTIKVDAGPDGEGGPAKQKAHASMVGSAKFRSGSLGLPRRLLPGLGLSACARTCPPACQSGDCRSRRRWEAEEDGLQTKSCVLARILCRARAHVRESSEQGAVHRGRGRSGQNSGRRGSAFHRGRGEPFSLVHNPP